MSTSMTMLDCALLAKARLRPEDIVVCGLGGVEAAYKEAGPVGPTYFASDPMGIWTSVAIGLALARPSRRVVLLAGDGDLTMNLQALITAATVAPANLRIVVFQNGTYASTGGQPLANADNVSLAVIAKGAGFAWTAETRDADATGRALDELFALSGLGLLAVHLDGAPAPGLPPGPLSQVEERALFMRSLGERSQDGRPPAD